ncbi:MAG: 5-formyltetrahydrofolate cyclo-ligase [Clostridiales bacterium]|nr:5-formyltetrahydrofolate cyclo-ligase [Clostridiales bacterium]
MSQQGNNIDYKEVLRKEMRKKRDSLTMDQICEQSNRCLDQLKGLLEFQKAEWIYSYMAIGSEVDTILMISEFIRMGKQVAVPKVEKDVIVFYEIQSIKDCKPGLFGILEPVSYKAPAEDPGLILLPGLAFDKAGNRLGYGGGYYDKYLKAHPDFSSVALAFELQLLDDVPCEKHDKQVEYIVTPDRIIKC